ncbi:MAG TPA: hypothetical protein VGM99_03450 [Candidatus Cybelea sp.]
MISGRNQNRRRALGWSALASAALHLIFLTLLFYELAHVIVARGSKERVSETTTFTIHRQAPSPPPPAPKHVSHVRVVRHAAAPRARAPRRELAKAVAYRAPPLPQHHPEIPTKIERDQAGFEKEVAQLNKQNDIHAIPTIDPGTQESATKDYGFGVPSSLRGEEHGNGIITPTRRWHDNGNDCYYGRYEFTYPDGAMEYGDIEWPFCYEPDSDPFKESPHEIPFPLPLPGYKLPPGTQLPPIEKSIYEHWAGAAGVPSSP